MNNIPIKFRGVDIFTQEVVYGDYLSPTECATLTTFDFPQIMNNEGVHWVFPDSVTQLAGYAESGEELYCGDVVVDSQGNEFVVEKWFMAVNDLNQVSLTNDCFKSFKK